MEASNLQTTSFTEIMFEDALKEARRLDDHLRVHGKPVGPLHGVPITLKDQFDVAGYDTTLGYTGRAFKPTSEDAVLVKMLRDLGAVVLGKTNLPQSIMASSRSLCRKQLYGLTWSSGVRLTTRSGA